MTVVIHPDFINGNAKELIKYGYVVFPSIRFIKFKFKINDTINDHDIKKRIRGSFQH